MNIEIRIENVVASADTRTKLNLQLIASSFDDIEYEPANFPGLIYHVNEPRGAIIFFSNGNLVCTGLKNIESVGKIVNLVLQKLKEIGISVPQPPEVSIQNIIASCDLKKLLNLNSIAITMSSDRVEYDPKHFAGLVYRTGNPPVVNLLFDSGKIVCSGARSIDDVQQALGEFIRELESTGLTS
jgi:transcription initiation factor TFIID TATA-box-binding protein